MIRTALIRARQLPPAVLILLAWWPAQRAAAQGDPYRPAYRGLTLLFESETGRHLRLKAVHVRADLHDGIAETVHTTVFSNDLAQAAQASLELLVPPDSVVTGYAYWFKGQRIEAKLLDNERAWEIYRTVTSRGRDPAIMEQWGDEHYHFQIYPVEPGKDLRVEVRYVAPWESEDGDFLYAAPFFQGKAMPTLAEASGTVRVHGVSPHALTDNFLGGPPVAEGSALVHRFHFRNWKPQADWRIRIRRPRGALAAYASGGRSGGSRGFAAIVLSPGRQVRRPRVSIRGVGAYDLYPRALRGIPAKGRFLVACRYRRSGPARITVRDGRRVYSARVVFPSARRPNSPATKFWAARRGKALTAGGRIGHWEHDQSESPGVRGAIVATSKRFGVVSPYTAWLAIPASELAFYKKLQSENRASTNAQSVGGGDPLIRIETTEDVVRATALLPTGELLALEPRGRGVWEVRFDLPYQTAMGPYRVTLVLERRDGTRRTLVLTYQVDRTAPAGDAQLQAEGGQVRVLLQADPDTTVVRLRLPGGNELPLAREADGRFAVCVPAAALAQGADLLLIDRAHNVTVLRVAPYSGEPGQ